MKLKNLVFHFAVLNSLLFHVAFRCRLFEMFRLEDMMKKLKIKATEAAQKLQQKLAGSAEHPAVAASPSTRADAHDDFPVGEEAFLADLRSRQQKRARQSEAEEQRPFAKPKVAQRQNKRSACAVSGSVEQPAAKRKYEVLSSELIQACAETNSSAEPPAEERDHPYELGLRNGSILNALRYSEMLHYGFPLGNVPCFQPCIVARYSDSPKSVDASR